MAFRSFVRTIAAAYCALAVSDARAQELSVPATLQGTVGAGVYGPRRMAVTSAGQFVVLDARGQLQLLTKRGDVVGRLLSGVKAAAAGGGRIYAVTEQVELVTLDDRTGKEQRRAKLGLGVGPTGLSYDGTRDAVWMAFKSGVVEARRGDGTRAVQLGEVATGLLYGLADVAYDGEAGLVWVAKDRETPGGMIFGLDPESGARVKAVGVSGAGPAKLTGSMLLGPGGRLYVSDMFGNRVEVVGSDDTRLGTIGVAASGEGQLSQPVGLALMENGDLLIANLYASRIDRYGSGAPLPECTGDGDCDGMSDLWEGAEGLDATSAKDALSDLDGDGLLNLEEYGLGTDPGNADTDGDGETDAEEVANGTDPLQPPNRKPVVVASGATEFVPGLVRLSATVTEIPDATKCVGEWKQSAEDEEQVQLSNGSGFGPTFAARRGTYRFTVRATCGGVTSDPVETAVTVLNVAPMAEATRVVVAETAQGGTTVTLDAGRSDDANRDALAYEWTQETGPSVSGGSTASTLTATFGAPGAHGFRVGVTDPGKLADGREASVVVVGKQPVPVAVVSSPVTGVVGQAIALDARGSIVSGSAGYAWQQVAGAGVPVAGSNLAKASFVASEAGRYAFEVTVTKAGVVSPPARVEVYVAAAGRALPVAAPKAPAVAAVGGEVTLDGAGSTSSGGGRLEYAWRQTAGPATGVGSADRAMATAYLFEAGSYEFELQVKDGAGLGVPKRVRVEGRKDGKGIPVAKVTGPATVVTGTEVSLDARGSTGATGWRWTQVGGPWTVVEGTSVGTFKPKTAGTYVFELEVDDGQVRSAPIRVSVAVTGDEVGN
jgi:hypothetical protein